MNPPVTQQLSERLRDTSPSREDYAVRVVDALLGLATECRASDLHLLPDTGGRDLLVQIRLDGVLHNLGIVPEGGPRVIARLKVLSGLLTYRTDVPQEGRLKSTTDDLEMRVSTFPTLHGEKCVVRLFVASGGLKQLEDLHLPAAVAASLQQLLRQPHGLLIVSGPSGSGKTTTLYAALRHLQRESITPRSLCTLEDPVEAVLPGVAQSQVKPDGEFTYARGLMSLMRQDPEVIMVGEIRDLEVARIVFQAALTGQLVLTSFHSGNAAEAVSRLCDMRIEPYLLRSGVLGILAQRLLRRTCTCVRSGAAGCPECRQTGYRGRLVAAELLQPDLAGLGRAILDREDATRIQELAVAAGMVPLQQCAEAACQRGETTSAELWRTFGPSG